MKRTRLIWILSAIVLLAAVSGGFALWHLHVRNQEIAAAVPRQPDLHGWNPELKERIASAERHAKHGPGRLAALAELSRLYHANGFYPEASQCYKGLLQVDPKPLWAHRLAFLLAQFGDLQHAIPLWRWVVKEDPKHIPASIRLGDALLKDNHLNEAAVAYNRALKIAPGNPYAELGLARIDISQGKWSHARTLLEAAAGSTDYAIGGDLLVTVYEHLGFAERALVLRGAVKASGAFYDTPDSWLDGLYSDCYDVYRLTVYSGAADHSGDVPTAIKIAERAVSLDPGSGQVQYQMGNLCEEANEPLKAMAAMKACIAASPQFSDAWYQLYALQRAAGNSASADQTLMAGLNACPNSPALHLELGNRLAQAGHIEQAIAQYRLSARLRPEEADAQISLAALYFKLNRINEGVDELKAALVAQPAQPAALTSITMVYIKLGHEAEAQKWLRQVSFQPRIHDKQREMLVQAFIQQFGHPPEINLNQ